MMEHNTTEFSRRYLEAKTLWDENHRAFLSVSMGYCQAYTWQATEMRTQRQIQSISKICSEISASFSSINLANSQALVSQNPVAVFENNIKAHSAVFGDVDCTVERLDDGHYRLTLGSKEFMEWSKRQNLVIHCLDSSLQLAAQLMRCAGSSEKVLEDIRQKHPLAFSVYDDRYVSEMLASTENDFDAISFCDSMARTLIDNDDTESVSTLIQQALMIVATTGKCLDENLGNISDFTNLVTDQYDQGQATKKTPSLMAKRQGNIINFCRHSHDKQ